VARGAPCLSLAAAGGATAVYRLDVAVGRLEFACHPGMAGEEQLVGGRERAGLGGTLTPTPWLVACGWEAVGGGWLAGPHPAPPCEPARAGGPGARWPALGGGR
jgi:hypothetical protein